jgi:hypothetical protein
LIPRTGAYSIFAVVSRNESVSRRVFLVRAGAIGVGLTAGELPGLAQARTRAQFRRSLSVSPFTEYVLARVRLTDGRHTARTVRQVQEMFNRHGASEMYARIATRREVNSSNARMGFAAGLERARLARGLNMPFNPELGLFATYGDASNYQTPPDFSAYPSIHLSGRWTGLTLSEMEAALHKYGRLVARQILATGVDVNYWDLGNEVEFGVAGVTPKPLSGRGYQSPDRVDPAIGQMSVAGLIGMSVADRIGWLETHLWPYIGRLFAATAAGIRSVDRDARFSTHISGIFEDTAELPLAFWAAMAKAGYHAEQLGTSYYPTAGAIGGAGNRLTWVKQTAAALHSRFGKQTMLSETGYPSGHLTGGYPYNTPVAGFPQTDTGQRDFLAELIHWGRGSGLLAGLRPWAPDLCLAGWGPMSLFTAHGHVGRAKPALKAFT